MICVELVCDSLHHFPIECHNSDVNSCAYAHQEYSLSLTENKITLGFTANKITLGFTARSQREKIHHWYNVIYCASERISFETYFTKEAYTHYVVEFSCSLKMRAESRGYAMV